MCETAEGIELRCGPQSWEMLTRKPCSQYRDRETYTYFDLRGRDDVKFVLLGSLKLKEG
jgi:hypothetical protein